MSIDFQSWTNTHLGRFETVLSGLLPSPEVAPQRLHQAMRYAVLQGGKRVRPLLAFAAAELVGAELSWQADLSCAI
jgi:farnesyl diphosphate synthase